MKSYVQLLTALQAKDRGAAMPEYGLLVALIAVVAAVGAGVLGGAVDTLFDNVSTTLN